MDIDKISGFISNAILSAILLCLLVFVFPASALSPEIEVDRLLFSAVRYTEAGKYAKAAEEFKKILALQVALPDKFYYHYGYHLYKINDYADAKMNIEK